MTMNRREALKAGTAALGGVLFASSGVVAAWAPERTEASTGILSRDDQALAEEIADTLLPATAASPGAKAAGVGATMNLLLTDCYATDEQRRIVSGLGELRAMCRDRCGDGFASMTRAERERMLREIDAVARTAGDEHWFATLRGLAQQAYFSSEVGMTRALRYVQAPGRWTGCVPLRPGQPAWG